MTLGTTLRRHAEAAPDAVFCTIVTGGIMRTMTFGELFRAGCAFAAELGRRGVGRGDVVPIILRTGPEQYQAFAGAVLAGAIPTFMAFPSAKQRPDVYWNDLNALFERIKPRLVVSYGENIANAERVLSGSAVEMLDVHDVTSLDVFLPASEMPGLGAAPDDIACLQHSSGTTGLKKGVMLTHRALLQHVDAYAKALDFTPSDSIVSWLPLYHDMGFNACFIGSLLRGTHLIALDPFEWSSRPSTLLDAIATHRPTFCWLPNFAFSHLVNTARRNATYDLSSIRAFINCSEPCKPDTFDRFLGKFAGDGVDAGRLGVCYAMAENVFAVTQTAPGRAATVLDVDAAAFERGRIVPGTHGTPKRLLSCGEPVDGVRIRVVDATGRDADPGVVGEIYVTSPFLFSGYYLQPDVTARKLRDGWYASGDLGFVHEGELYVTGRVDDMLILNGRNFYAHEIEAIVNEIDGVIPGRSVAIAVDDARTDATGVVVLVECRTPFEHGMLQRRVREEVFDRLGLSVAAVVTLAAQSLVKTTSGKISRVENRKLYLENAFSELVG